MRKENNKIQIPNVESEYVERPADLLLASLSERVIVLNAGAGYGKTQILSHYVHKCEEKSAWYSLSENDNELMSFVRNFTRSVYCALGSRGEEFKASVSLQEDLDVLVENLVVWLDGQREGMNVILDDFQEIYHPDIFNLLNVLIETLGEKIRFFIVVMRSLPAFLEEYVQMGAAACIGTEDLKFHPEDIACLMQYPASAAFQKQAAELIYFYTEGWPVGVIQIVQTIRRRKREITYESLKEICEKLEVSDYFMTRVYRMLPFDIQTFLKKTSVLDYMTVPVCNSILENYQSDSLLKYLVKEKLFVQSLGEQSGVYRYHSIFQRFLLSQISDSEQKECLKRAAYFYLKTEDKIQAAEYGCRAKAAEVVQAVIEVSGEDILTEKLYDTLKRWFAFLYRQNCPLTAKSRFIYGKYLWVTGNPLQAREQIQEAGKIFRLEGKHNDYKRVLLFVAETERKAGNLKQTAVCLEEIDQLPEKYWNPLSAAICTEHVKYACCMHQMEDALLFMENWKNRGVLFSEYPFLAAAEQVLKKQEGGFPAFLSEEIEDGFLLQSCILAEHLTSAYHAADFQSVSEDAQHILKIAEYETLHTAIAWKMLAILSWNKRNYRKAMEQAGIGDKFLYRNQIQLHDFTKKHQQILGEIDFLQKNLMDERYRISQKTEHPPTVSAPESTKKIRIQCMKRFCVMLREGEETEVRWRTKKARELFAYLFHLQGEGVAREDLITLLWPESGTKSATALFHTTLYSIRQTFTLEGWGELIVYDKKKYSLNMEMVSSDLEILQTCFREFREEKKDPEQVLQLYTGSYMGNTGYLWSYGTAKKLEDEYLLVCRAGAARRMQENQEALAIPFLQRMQEIEPYDEEVVVSLIICLYKSKKQTEAKQQYDRMVKLYKEDLNLDFEKTFQELVEP